MAVVKKKNVDEFLRIWARNKEFWIGLTLQKMEWRWPDGSAVEYKGWPDDVNPKAGKGSCTVANHNGMWARLKCTNKRAYACSHTFAVECKENWTVFWNGCYRYFPIHLDRIAAKKACIDEKASLATVESPDNKRFIKEMTRGKPTWIGLVYLDNKWEWDDGTPYVNEHWAEVDGTPHDQVIFAYMTDEGAWKVADAGYKKMGFVCKYKASTGRPGITKSITRTTVTVSPAISTTAERRLVVTVPQDKLLFGMDAPTVYVLGGVLLAIAILGGFILLTTSGGAAAPETVYYSSLSHEPFYSPVYDKQKSGTVTILGTPPTPASTPVVSPFDPFATPSTPSTPFTTPTDPFDLNKSQPAPSSAAGPSYPSPPPPPSLL